MGNRLIHLAALGLAAFGLLCWMVIFLAGTDVWHYVGSPDFWKLQGPPYADLRVCAYAFYLLFIVLVASLAVTTVGLVIACRTRAQS